MIADAKRMRAQALQERFVDMLPSIHQQARVPFRGKPEELRQELTAEVVANCYVAFVRLVERGLDDVIYPTPLAQYAIRQTLDGRKVGSSLNVNDVSST